MEITVGYWKTRDGRKARVLCTDGPEDYPAVGYIEGSLSYTAGWDLNGKEQDHGVTCSDLIEPWTEKKVIKLTTWLCHDTVGEGYFIQECTREPVTKIKKLSSIEIEI